MSTLPHRLEAHFCCIRAYSLPPWCRCRRLMLWTSPPPLSPPQAAAVDVPSSTHPMDLEASGVTNEHTAQMTLARASALEYYQAGK